ncbi:hypothetical protein ACFOGG_16075 [Brenneria rubrifaciens]
MQASVLQPAKLWTFQHGVIALRFLNRLILDGLFTEKRARKGNGSWA